jgi:hypothetical protein
MAAALFSSWMRSSRTKYVVLKLFLTILTPRATAEWRLATSYLPRGPIRLHAGTRSDPVRARPNSPSKWQAPASAPLVSAREFEG